MCVQSWFDFKPLSTLPILFGRQLHSHEPLTCNGEHGGSPNLEAALIEKNLLEKGCRNEKFGGDGPKHLREEPFHFVYIVGARADRLKAIR